MSVNSSKRRYRAPAMVPPWLPLLTLLLTLAAPATLLAEVEFEWAGFGTVGGGVLDDNSINEANNLPHNLYDDDLQYDVDTRLGFQGTWFFDEQLSATLQVVSNSVEDEDAELEWAYVSYDVSQNLKLRIGRQRRPLYALSDVLPVGYVYPWARPPIEVYARDVQVYDALDAIDVLYTSRLGDWDATTEFYYGGSSGEAQIAFGEEGDYKTRDDHGIILQLEKDWLTLRFGYHRSPDLDVDPSQGLVMLFAGLEAAGYSSIVADMRKQGLEGEFLSLSTGIDYEDWLFNAEIIHVPVEGGAVPTEDSWYLMGGRRFGPWTAHLTYAERVRESNLSYSGPIYADAAMAPPGPPGFVQESLLGLAAGVDAVVDGLKIDQNSYTLGLRYDFEQPVSVKIEYQHIIDNQYDLSNNLLSVVVDFLF